MEKVGDWSNLTTVNFVGGMCGDFICSLVYNSYYNTPFIIDNKVSKVTFNRNIDNKSILFDTTFFRVFHLLSELYYVKQSADKLDQVIKNFISINFADKHYETIKKIYDQCCDENQQYYVENIQEVCRSIIPNTIQSPTLLTHLSFDHDLDGLHVSKVFPKSNNILLTTSEKKYYNYFRILAFHKYYAKNWPNLSLKQAYEYLYQYERPLLDLIDRKPPYHPYDYQSQTIYTPIYVDKFLFEDSYIEHIEDIFGKYFNSKLSFNREIIEQYKIKNKNIIAYYLGCEPNFNYKDDMISARAEGLVNTVSYISSFEMRS